MHPFDPRAILFAKHAQHVVLIHFPIALFITGAIFDVVAQRTNSAVTAAAARYNLVGAAIATPPVLLTGVLAWRWALGAPKVAGILLLHMIAGCTAGLLVMTAGWIHLNASRRAASLPTFRIPVEIVGVMLVALTAHLGGFLSGVNLP